MRKNVLVGLKVKDVGLHWPLISEMRRVVSFGFKRIPQISFLHDHLKLNNILAGDVVVHKADRAQNDGFLWVQRNFAELKSAVVKVRLFET